MWRTLALAAVAAVAVAASPPACRAGLGAFQVSISDGARRRRLDGVNHTTHAERVAQRRREWKLRKKSKHAAAERARAANATCYGLSHCAHRPGVHARAAVGDAQRDVRRRPL